MAKILIVDDEEKIRRILALLLKGRKHQVTEAASGEEALEIAPELQPDLVLLDIQMSGIDEFRILQGFEGNIVVFSKRGPVLCLGRNGSASQRRPA